MQQASHPPSDQHKPQLQDGVWLTALTFVGAALGYAISIVAARILGSAGFENYAVAVASLGLLSTLAEAGAGKYALKAIPLYSAMGDWHLVAGYWRFSVRLSLGVSLAILLVVATWEGAEDLHFGDYPLGVGILFLPAIALCGVGVDFVMANRAAITGALIARLLVPLTTLVLLVTIGVLGVSKNPSVAIACFGCGSLAGVVWCAYAFYRTSSPEVFSTRPEYRRREWFAECLNFGISAFVASWMFRISILVMEALPVAESEVAYLAAAMDTGCLILILAKSTDKLFQPEMARIIGEADYESGTQLRRSRLMLVGGACCLFMISIIFFGRWLLSLYGEQFKAGYPALCFIALGASVTTMFSLAPAYLKFRRRSTFVIVTMIGAALAMIGLTVGLGYSFGATGAGIAFCIVLCVLTMIYLSAATRDFEMLETEALAQNRRIPADRDSN